MAKLNEATGRKDGGYTRLFDHEQLGELTSMVHSAVIRSGTELEKTISDAAKTNNILIGDLDEFLADIGRTKGVWIAPKGAINRSNTVEFKGSPPDFIVFDCDRKIGFVVELKDGDTFDTKHIASEINSFENQIEILEPGTGYECSIKFCAFNQIDNQRIVEGFKRKISLNQAMTGPEFCDLLMIDYEAIVVKRKVDSQENVVQFVSELMDIEDIRGMICEELQRRGQRIAV